MFGNLAPNTAIPRLTSSTTPRTPLPQQPSEVYQIDGNAVVQQDTEGNGVQEKRIRDVEGTDNGRDGNMKENQEPISKREVTNLPAEERNTSNKERGSGDGDRDGMDG